MDPLRHPYRSQAVDSGYFSDATVSFQEIEDALRGAFARGEITTKQQGDLFEVFCEAILRLHHLFGARDVWPTGRIPSEHLAALNIRSADRGIDGLFVTNDGKLGAYQAKFRSDGGSLTWSELATFVGYAERADQRLVVTNARGIAKDASERRDVTALLGHELRALPENLIRQACALIQGSRPPPAVRHSPLEHQRIAIKAAQAALASAARCTLIMACGSGKTLTALWIAERMLSDRPDARVLVLLPSLALVRQMLEEWSVQQSWGDAFRFCCVCSDESVANRDDVVVRQEDVPFPVTTDAGQVREFLAGGGVRIVLSTYQSAVRVAEAVGDLSFDLGIFDEAHRTARGVGSEFAMPLSEENLPIDKRLFMTATRRVFSASVKDRAPVASMDDPELYGKIAYSLNFRQAADLGIICAPKVVVSVVTGSQLRGVLADAGVEVGKRTLALRDIACRYALAEAMKRLDLKKAFTFHGTVARARDFVQDGAFGLEDFLRGYGRHHVSGAMKTADRDLIMDEFEAADRAVVSNARCLNEGVDVPAVDMVAFMDPKKSMIDIVQAIGRALRRAPGKTHGYVLLPVFIEDDGMDDIDAALEKTDFRAVWYVLRALMDQDRLMTETINRLRIMSRGGQTIAREALEGFLTVIGSDRAEALLRDKVTLAVVERLGDTARMDCRPIGRLVKVTGVDRVVGALSDRFGKRFLPSGNGKIVASEDGTIRIRLSCCNGYYEHEGAYFNQVKPSDFDLDFYVTWSSYTDFGFAVPCDRLERYLKSVPATEKKNGTFLDWNPVTYFDDEHAYMMMRKTPLDVSSYRVRF